MALIEELGRGFTESYSLQRDQLIKDSAAHFFSLWPDRSEVENFLEVGDGRDVYTEIFNAGFDWAKNDDPVYYELALMSLIHYQPEIASESYKASLGKFMHQKHNELRKQPWFGKIQERYYRIAEWVIQPFSDCAKIYSRP